MEADMQTEHTYTHTVEAIADIHNINTSDCKVDSHHANLENLQKNTEHKGQPEQHAKLHPSNCIIANIDTSINRVESLSPNRISQTQHKPKPLRNLSKQQKISLYTRMSRKPPAQKKRKADTKLDTSMNTSTEWEGNISTDLSSQQHHQMTEMEQVVSRIVKTTHEQIAQQINQLRENFRTSFAELKSEVNDMKQAIEFRDKEIEDIIKASLNS